MNDRSLRDVLDRATELIEPPDLAAVALAEARRRRTRRRGAVAALTAAAAVVVLIVSARVITGDRTTEPPPADPASSGTTQVPVAPAIPVDRIQPLWDPRGVEGLPVLDLGVPQVLPVGTTGGVDTAVALLDRDDETLLVGSNGVQTTFDLPPGLGARRTVSLSPDGTRVAAVGISGFFWRSLAGAWTRVDVPTSVLGEWIEVTWMPGAQAVVLRGDLAGVRVDLSTGIQRELGFLRGYVAWGPAPDGRVVAGSGPASASAPSVRELVGDQSVRRTYLGPLENLQRPVVGAASIAAARANTSFPDPPAPDDQDGLIALERGSLATRAFLPVRYEASYYVDGGALTPRAWLDDDTVLFTVLPKGAAKEYLVAWNVDTGQLSRVACWPSDFDATFAVALLANQA
ncbi:hypothetical protein [Nocardioides sp. W7]|uniref:hypothetical protein n=1 Tax=Nocardioides sp. W7 TaxID=2931390 RepID=UPI001FD5F75A|nr:hypothetical protein [Nocardioides sp. W7]